VHAEAKVRQLKTIDATCPLVTKVHMEAKRFAADDVDIVLIGHEGHEEVVGTTGQAPENIHLVDGVEEAAQVQVRDPAKVAYLSQTTLSVDETNTTVDALRRRFPLLQGPPSRTSATPPRTARWRSRRSPTSPTSCSWWARATAPTRCAWSRSRWTPAPGRPTSWTTPPRSTRPGWTA
jgi:4-hydroxy-3-methylbut-2-enyl diphosphate reductase IspH